MAVGIGVAVGYVLTTVAEELREAGMGSDLMKLLEFGDTKRLSLDSKGSPTGFCIGVGFCNDSTCADSEKYGLETCWISPGLRGDCCDCRPDIDRDARCVMYESSRISDSLVDLVERVRHFQKRVVLLELLRCIPTRLRSAQ